MQKNHIELWAECLQFIKSKIGDTLFLTWFNDVQSLSFANGELHLHVPSSFFAEYIDDRFIGIVTEAISKVYGPGVTLFYNYNLAQNDAKSDVNVKSTSDNLVLNKKKDGGDPFAAQNVAPFDPQLNPRFTFGNYCCSESNKIAVSVSEAIAAKPSMTQFNPLFVFGPTGVGKTHLIQAIGISIKESHPSNRVLYVTARVFTSQYTSAVTRGETNMFFNFYQSIHTLIVDDVQDLNGKQSTQNTFYHIFNHLYLNNRRIILSSDRAPADMEGFEERLLGRFKCGISVPLEKPDIALRRGVLAMKARQDGIVLDDEVIDYIAENVTESIRELEGVMVSLVAHATILNKPISIDLARIVVQNAIKIKRKTINFEMLVDVVSSFYNIEPDRLFTKSRKREISDARQMLMYLAKKHTGMPLSAIGRRLARSHSTVIYAIESIEQRLEFDKKLRSEIDKIEAMLKEQQ